MAEVLCLGADLFSIVKGTPNRRERKEARKLGEEPPPLDRWNRQALFLSILALALAALLILIYVTKD